MQQRIKMVPMDLVHPFLAGIGGLSRKSRSFKKFFFKKKVFILYCAGAGETETMSHLRKGSSFVFLLLQLVLRRG
jgi:hypothetical protein